MIHIHLASGAVFHGITQLRRCFHLRQIQYTATFVTDKMHMGLGISIEPFVSVHSAYTLNQTLVAEQRKIPVDSGKRNIRTILFNAHIHHLSRGVFIGCLKVRKDRIALFELLLRFHLFTS